MASGSKESSAFTANSMTTGNGKSTGISDANIGKGGQKIRTAYPQDNVSGVDLPNTRGGTLRGSTSNLGHSLKGATAVQDGPGAAGSVKYNTGD